MITSVPTTTTATGYGVEVLFATSYEPRIVATFADRAAAERRAREYQGCDARGLWLVLPNGTREALSVR